MTVERRVDEQRRVLIMGLKGKLIGHPICYEFLEAVRDELSDDRPNVLLEMSQVDRVNSTGIGILASIFTSARNHGGKVCIVGASNRLRLLIEASGLEAFLHLCGTMEEALQARG